MTEVIVDKARARNVLLTAYWKKKEQKDVLGKSIREVITGSHKTYRYVLVTGLLAKATEKAVDPLSLQAKDASDGAYDARSIAHKVLVPFEREHLPNSLGNSNEPYLNKPARFPRLSLDNAVRKGGDRIILEKTISILSQMNTVAKALKYLKSALSVMEEVSREFNKKYEIDDTGIEPDKTAQSILDYVCRLVDKPCEGEICPIVVSTLESLYQPKTLTVRPHKVNESGSSSKEIGDIDITNAKGKVLTSIEVKDKNFGKEDVEHAIRKFRAAGLKRTMFVYGKNVTFDHISVYQLAARYGRMDCYCCVISILDYAKLRLYSIDDIDLRSFESSLLCVAKCINAKDSTIEWIKNSAALSE